MEEKFIELKRTFVKDMGWIYPNTDVRKIKKNIYNGCVIIEYTDDSNLIILSNWVIAYEYK